MKTAGAFAAFLAVVVVCLGSLAADTASRPAYFRRDGGVGPQGHAYPEALDPTAEGSWRTPLDGGISTPCLWGDYLYLTTHHDTELAVVAVHRDSGRTRWKRAVPVEQLERFHATGSPASASPACDGERLYVFFGSYGLLAYDLEGQLLWEHKIGPFQDEFGASSSPVPFDDRIFLNEDHDVDSFLAAFDKASGKMLWRVPRQGFTRSYSTPVLWENEGSMQLVVAGALRVTGYDPADGRRLWWADGLSRIVSPTPAVAGERLYVAGWTPGGDRDSRLSMGPWSEAKKKWDQNGDGKIAAGELPEGPVLTRFFRIDLDQDGKIDAEEWTQHARVFERAQNALMALRPGGEGDISATHVVWKHHRSLPSVPSPLVYEDVVFTVKDSGIVTSLDAATGEVIRQGRAPGLGNYYASPVAAGGKVYLASERGVVSILSAKGEWEVLSSHDLGERIMATPVPAEGSIYLRTDEALYRFGAGSASR